MKFFLISITIVGSFVIIYNSYVFYRLYFKGVDFVYDREKALDAGKNKFGIRDVDYDFIITDKLIDENQKKYLIRLAQIDQEIIQNSKNKELAEILYLKITEIEECVVILYENNLYFEKKVKDLLKNSTEERNLFHQEFWRNIDLRFRSFMSDENSKVICPKHIENIELSY